MVCEESESQSKPVDAVELTSADMSEILELIALAEPGHFFTPNHRAGAVPWGSTAWPSSGEGRRTAAP
jgi:hypothetical protein